MQGLCVNKLPDRQSLRSGERGTAEVRVAKNGVFQVRFLEGAFTQIAIGEIRAGKYRPVEIHTVQIGLEEGGIPEMASLRSVWSSTYG
jgi:hypothetical protein